MSGLATPEDQALQQAAEWVMRISEGSLSPGEQQQWQAWRNSSPACAQAWQRAERLLEKLGSLPPSLAMPTLDRPSNPQRRAALGRLAALLAITPMAWAAWQLNRRQGWTADYRSAIGQRRDLTLADGSHLTLNTDTALDVRFDQRQRLLVLRHGEILVQTGVDKQRALLVETAQGRLRALGTRFSVRQRSASTQLVVLEGAVQIELFQPLDPLPTIVQAGQSTEFTRESVNPPGSADSALTSWTTGMLVADNMPLAELLGELARYSHGFVRCPDNLARLRVSGAFPVDDKNRTLRMLALTYPLKVESHLDGYWIMLSPS